MLSEFPLSPGREVPTNPSAMLTVEYVGVVDQLFTEGGGCEGKFGRDGESHGLDEWAGDTVADGEEMMSGVMSIVLAL